MPICCWGAPTVGHCARQKYFSLINKYLKMKRRSLITLIIGVFIIAISGCDVLDEQVIDESLTGAGEAETVSGAIVPAYGQLAWTWRHTNYFGLQELA